MDPPPPVLQPDSSTTSITRDALAELIANNRFSIALQPIVNLRTGDILGYEALTRLDDASLFPDTGALFDAAADLGLLGELEAAARLQAFVLAAERPGEELIFINNSPPVMVEPGFAERLLREIPAGGALKPERVILEITERTDYDQLDELKQQIDLIRSLGFDIALDDVGSGLSGLNRMMALRPKWVKLDRELIADIDRHPLQQNLIRSLLRFVNLSNMFLIAEGIEREGELATLVDMGVCFGQGFFLARPQPTACDIPNEIKRTIQHVQERSSVRRSADPSTLRISTLARPVELFDASTSCHDVLRHLLASPDEHYAVILDGKRYRGVPEQHQLALFCQQHLHSMPIGAAPLMRCTVVGADVTLAEALDLAAGRASDQLAQPFVVQTGGIVRGLIPFRAVLHAAAEAHRRVPSHLAALTGLPGRAEAETWLERHIRARDPHNVSAIDLRDFDAYNIAYGFEMGDAMLLRLVGLVNVLLQDECIEDHFFAHLGEDRFLLAARHDLQTALLRLFDRFHEARQELFSAADLRSGHFRCRHSDGTQSAIR